MLKTRIATIVSIVGVMVAGLAAAMVNTQIFASEPTVAGESAALLAPQPTIVRLADHGISRSTTTTTAPGITADPSAGDQGGQTGQTAPPSRGTPSSPANPPAQADPPARAAPSSPAGGLAQADPAPSLLTEYAVGASGAVTVDVLDGRLRIVSVNPASGWTVVSQQEHSSGTGVDVVLSSGKSTVGFSAALVDGRIVAQLDDLSTPGAGTRGDHDDDNEYEDDDHDDDDDDDEYEDEDEDDHERDHDDDEYDDYDD